MVKSKVKKSVTKAGRKRVKSAGAHRSRKDLIRTSRKTKKHVIPIVPKSQISASPQQKSTASAQAVDAKETLSPNHAAPEMLKSQSGVDLTEKIKELVRLAGTRLSAYGDINDALPDNVVHLKISMKSISSCIILKSRSWTRRKWTVSNSRARRSRDKSRLDTSDPVGCAEQMGQVRAHPRKELNLSGSRRRK
jgi:hypothetical protein